MVGSSNSGAPVRGRRFLTPALVRTDGPRRCFLSRVTNSERGGVPTVAAMSTLDEVKTWLDEQLPALIEKYDVPGAAVAVLAGGEVVDGAAGVLSKATGVEATADSVFQIGSITKLWTEHAGHAAGRRGQGRPRRAGPHLPARVQDRRRGRRPRRSPRASCSTTRPASRATSSPTPASATTASRSTSASCTRSRSCSRPASSSPTTTPATACSAGWSRCSARRRTTTCLREHLFAPLGLTHAATGPYEAIMFRAADGPHRARARHRLPARPGLGAGPLQRAGRLDARRCARATCSPSPRCT